MLIKKKTETASHDRKPQIPNGPAGGVGGRKEDVVGIPANA